MLSIYPYLHPVPLTSPSHVRKEKDGGENAAPHHDHGHQQENTHRMTTTAVAPFQGSELPHSHLSVPISLP